MPRRDPPFSPRPLSPSDFLDRKWPKRFGGIGISYPRWLDGWPGRKRPRRDGDDLEREPVEPPRPKGLSGGAAAELEFDE